MQNDHTLCITESKTFGEIPLHKLHAKWETQNHLKSCFDHTNLDSRLKFYQRPNTIIVANNCAGLLLFCSQVSAL